MVRAALRGGHRIGSGARGIDMVGNARDDDGQGDLPQDEAALSARLRRLGDELGRERPRPSPDVGRASMGGASSGWARGIRLSSEFIAGILVGAGIGWAIDRVFGTSPLGLIVFLLLGFAVGVVNLVRAASDRPAPE